MKRILYSMVLAVLSLVGTEASAAPCAIGTLTTYVGLGSGGCTIGNVTFANFSLLGGPTGASNFPVVLTPFLLGTGIGFEFTSAATADSGLLDDVIGYTASGGATISFVGADLSLANSVGLVTAIDNFCFNGAYSTTLVCSSGNEGVPLLVLGGFQDSDSTTFAGSFAAVGIATDLGLDGSDGPASLGTARSTLRIVSIAAVPEPESIALVAIGFLALVARGRRRGDRMTFA